MGNEKKRRLSVGRLYGLRVSSAVWPPSVRKVVATGQAAQRRRDWIMQGRWWMLLLVEVLFLRVLFILATLLVVVASLLVALLGLRFWYLLVFPLLLFIGVLIIPALLTARMSEESVPQVFATFAQDLRNSAEMVALTMQDLKSQSGALSLKNQSGSLRNQTGSYPVRSTAEIYPEDARLTPLPVEQPLVRVLETYDLRSSTSAQKE
jgi:hypothetical protein